MLMLLAAVVMFRAAVVMFIILEVVLPGVANELPEARVCLGGTGRIRKLYT